MVAYKLWELLATKKIQGLNLAGNTCPIHVPTYNTMCLAALKGLLKDVTDISQQQDSFPVDGNMMAPAIQVCPRNSPLWAGLKRSQEFLNEAQGDRMVYEQLIRANLVNIDTGNRPLGLCPKNRAVYNIARFGAYGDFGNYSQRADFLVMDDFATVINSMRDMARAPAETGVPTTPSATNGLAGIAQAKRACAYRLVLEEYRKPSFRLSYFKHNRRMLEENEAFTPMYQTLADGM